MMNGASKDAWVAALRSGEYEQGVGALQTNDGCNCCLGVLARVNNVPSELMHEADVFTFRFHGEKDVDYTAFPPDDWMGLDYQTQIDLADMNDKGNTFEEIATYIEDNL